LGGWLFLDWGPSLALRPVGAVELLARLAQRRSWQTLASDPAMLLALASLPAYDLVRPQDWAVLGATCGLHRVPGQPRAECPRPGRRKRRVTPTLQETARCLALDATAAATHGMLREAGIANVLLKGSGVARLLYGEQPGLRVYSNVDLLVAPAAFEHAQEVLAGRG